MTQQTIPKNKRIEVNASDLHMFYTALSAAHNYVDMGDMQLALSAMAVQKRETPLALTLREARERVAGIISDAMRDEFLESDLDEDDLDEQVARFEDEGGQSAV
jgi:hypothetical protein